MQKQIKFIMDKKLEKKIRALIREALGNAFGKKYECIEI